MRIFRKDNLLFFIGVLVAVAVFFKNSWVSEDAYILFRSLEQLFAGNGPVWNPHERVQVFTSPLWYILLAVIRIFSEDHFLNSILLSLALFLTVLFMLRSIYKDNTSFFLSVLLLCASNGFFDYTSSGLENILGYAVITLFISTYFCVFDCNSYKRDLDILLLLSGLVILVRHDLALLVLPSAVYAVIIRFRSYSRRHWAVIIILSFLPFFAFTLFSLLYYGFPFPNTAYAKLNTGIDKVEIIKQGLCYFYSSLLNDSITLVVIFTAIALSLFSHRGIQNRYLGYGIILNLLYIIYIGGDFMQGRFFSFSYLISVIIIVRGLPKPELNRIRVFSFILIAAYLFLYPHTPLNSGFYHQNTDIEMGIADERGFYFQWLSLPGYLSSDWEDNLLSGFDLAHNAVRFKSSDNKLIVSANIGIFGYYSGLDKIIIDKFALSDPLLAGMPVSGMWRIGHFQRRIPDGYIESILNDSEIIEEKKLNEYYKKLRLITQGKRLLSRERLKTILLFNLHYYDHLLERETL